MTTFAFLELPTLSNILYVHLGTFATSLLVRKFLKMSMPDATFYQYYFLLTSYQEMFI